ncbi:hypothetical protein [Natrinema sp. DC36]|uniref:hypothetical protein n=1 Tax=Natrinema sp. DC36 TaxID=2878680 RepID=UPI001CF09713|nr:hypothetical protein [Natrinema sp. DC36]
MMTSAEKQVARFTRWLRQRPNSIEFWELVLTDERLVWCYVGQSYRSMLLRADMGERDRALVDDRPLEDLLSLAEVNFAVPLSDLEEISLLEGTRFRRAQLDLRWRAGGEHGDADRYGGEMTLVATGDAASHADLVAELAEDPRLDHVDVSVESRGWPFR